MTTITSDTKLVTKIDDTQESLAAIRGCLPVLEKIADQSELLALLPEPERIALISAAGRISRPDRKEIKKRNKDKNRQNRLVIVEKERGLRVTTSIRQAREASVFIAPLQILCASPRPYKKTICPQNSDPGQKK